MHMKPFLVREMHVGFILDSGEVELGVVLITTNAVAPAAPVGVDDGGDREEV